MQGLLLYLKDKEFFVKEATLRKVGGISSIKHIYGNYDLLHIIDLDLERGQMKNYDVYDSLTRNIHTQVECSHTEIAKHLQRINVRAVLLPPYKGWEELNPSFLAARVEEPKDTWICEHIRDIVTSNRKIASSLPKKNRLFSIGFSSDNSFCVVHIKSLRDLMDT